MFGTGVFEIILLWWGISYFYMFSRKKDETEYIQLNEEQFDQLRYTLATMILYQKDYVLTVI